jgi:hypothetical protein
MRITWLIELPHIIPLSSRIPMALMVQYLGCRILGPDLQVLEPNYSAGRSFLYMVKPFWNGFAITEWLYHSRMILPFRNGYTTPEWFYHSQMALPSAR